MRAVRYRPLLNVARPAVLLWTGKEPIGRVRFALERLFLVMTSFAGGSRVRFSDCVHP